MSLKDVRSKMFDMYCLLLCYYHKGGGVWMFTPEHLLVEHFTFGMVLILLRISTVKSKDAFKNLSIQFLKDKSIQL